MAFYQLATRTPEASKRFTYGLSCVILPASVVREANDAIQAIPLMRGDDAAVIIDPVYRTASLVKGGAARWFAKNQDDPRFVCSVTDGRDAMGDFLHYDPENERQWLPVLAGMIAALYTARTGGDDIYAEGLGADDDYRGVTEWVEEYRRTGDHAGRCPYCGAKNHPQRIVSADIHVGPRAGTTGRFCNTVCRSVYFEPYGGNHIPCEGVPARDPDAATSAQYGIYEIDHQKRSSHLLVVTEPTESYADAVESMLNIAYANAWGGSRVVRTGDDLLILDDDGYAVWGFALRPYQVDSQENE